MNSDGTFDILYDDGGNEWYVKAENIKLIAGLDIPVHHAAADLDEGGTGWSPWVPPSDAAAAPGCCETCDPCAEIGGACDPCVQLEPTRGAAVSFGFCGVVLVLILFVWKGGRELKLNMHYERVRNCTVVGEGSPACRA